jgi:hypothetical protein
MPTSSLNARLAALEAKRDARIDALWKAWFARVVAVLGHEDAERCHDVWADGEGWDLCQHPDPAIRVLGERLNADSVLSAINARLCMYEWARVCARSQQGVKDIYDRS